MGHNPFFDAGASQGVPAPPPAKPRVVRSEVKGPIRCHKCQLNCHDASEYLGHKCEPKPQRQ
jgi:hypothetical protein